VAALASWHVAHESARLVAGKAAIPAHARIETYSVLTRMPPPHRFGSELAAALLERWFPAARTLVPAPALSHDLVARCADRGVAGGAVYDALVGLTASEADLAFVTRDERAARTYRRLGIAFELVR